MVLDTDKDKKTIRIGFEDVEIWPIWCMRETKDCRQCHFAGKIACHPRFRVGIVKSPTALPPREIVGHLLKAGKRPMEVHVQTKVPLPTIYSIGQRLRQRGELARLYEPHPESQKKEIIAYCKEHPDEEYIVVAQRFQVDRSYVSRICGKAGIHRRQYLASKTDGIVDDAIRMLETEPSRSIASVAEELHMSPTTLAYKMRKKGKMPLNNEARVFLKAVREEVIAAVFEAFSRLRKERIGRIEVTEAGPVERQCWNSEEEFLKWYQTPKGG